MRRCNPRVLLMGGALVLGLTTLGSFTGCNNPQDEAGTVKVEPRGQEAAPVEPAPVDATTRESSEGGPR